MTAKRSTTDGTGTKKVRRIRADVPATSTASQPDRERRSVDVDPWAILLEQLTEAPEESVPAERKRGKGEYSRGLRRGRSPLRVRRERDDASTPAGSAGQRPRALRRRAVRARGLTPAAAGLERR